MAEANDIHLTIKGMTCQGCVNSVTRIVKKADPDATVSIDLPTGKLDAQTKATSETLIKAINGAGYEARAA
jgi:copper chaperone